MQRNRVLLILLVIAAIGLAVAGGWYFFRPNNVIIDSDRVVDGDFTVAKNERLVLKNGAKLDVRGSLKADGQITCDGGPLRLSVQKDFTLNSGLSCLGSISDQGAIAIVVGGRVMMDPRVKVVTDGTLQFVDRAEKLLATPKALETIFDETETDSGTGKRLGPLSHDGVAYQRVADEHESLLQRGLRSVLAAVSSPAQAQAQDGDPRVTISGDWQIVGSGETAPDQISVQTQNPKIKKVLLYFDFGKDDDVQLKDLSIKGPDGHHGDNQYDVCNARGADGQDAMRFNVRAAKLSINHFTLTLGNGGDGGIAKTKKDCDPGVAVGGAGGKPGNFKMTASDDFIIAGAFDVIPGKGGHGGEAIAMGRDGIAGCPGQKGGDATATGGKGGDSLETLKAAGSVGGLDQVRIYGVQGGIGGDATATGGKGGDGNACKCGGGAGGKATAMAGDGGKANTPASAAQPSMIGGDGGNASSNGGNGGTGASCSTGPAGNGGAGAAAVSKAGKGGVGTTKNGADGVKRSEVGGNGGNGGDGCGEGNGGAAGPGNPAGTPGNKGKRSCKIDVIKYQNDYIRVSNLIKANADVCPEQHWHSHVPVPLINSGQMVSDPNPGACGFCPVSQCPVIQIDEPAGAMNNPPPGGPLQVNTNATLEIHIGT